MDNKNLTQLRVKIDEIDKQIQKLINDRANIAVEVSKEKIKSDHNIKHFYRPEREAEIFEKIKKCNQGPLSDEKILLIFREIMSACLALESPLKVSFLGPEGTFTQQAAFKHFGQSIDAQPHNTIEAVFRSVELNQSDFGVVPIENSYEGAVGSTLDNLQQSSLKICGEVQIPIHHYLMAKNENEKIERIFAHPQALAQCKMFLRENYPKATLESISSNAVGAQKAMNEPNCASIAPEIASFIYGLKIIAGNIQDGSKNSTRFLVIGNYECDSSKEDKTSIVFSASNKPGSLYSMLKPFEKYQINMNKLESRPSKTEQWSYIFFVDVDCHKQNENFKKAIKEIEEQQNFIKILGSYPKRIN